MLAKLSIPFNVGVAMQRGDVAISDFFDDKLVDEDVRAMAERVHSRFDPRFNFMPGSGFPGGEMEIVTRDGRTLTRNQARAYGHPEKPMSWDGLIGKFRDCASYAARPASADGIDRAVAMLRDLEHIDDVAEVVALIG
jgi:2-methylcitrate dehydratase PrpD